MKKLIFAALLFSAPVYAQTPRSAVTGFAAALAENLASAYAENDALKKQVVDLTVERDALKKQVVELQKQMDAAKAPPDPK